MGSDIGSPPTDQGVDLNLEGGQEPLRHYCRGRLIKPFQSLHSSCSRDSSGRKREQPIEAILPQPRFIVD